MRSYALWVISIWSACQDLQLPAKVSLCKRKKLPRRIFKKPVNSINKSHIFWTENGKSPVHKKEEAEKSDDKALNSSTDAGKEDDKAGETKAEKTEENGVKSKSASPAR